uniref:Uncharacterized protein n=1 Tax=Spongospora subterranea TaxID=70186 RepID=A0A0H5QLW2_9EUKA|eukprot:CRZ03145.1 hypothetical protein [Spongospora subterranea]
MISNPMQILAGTATDVENQDLYAVLTQTRLELDQVKAALMSCQVERDQALARIAILESAQPPIMTGDEAAATSRIGLSKQLECLALALHSASAEVEANDIELQMERQRRLAAKSIADDLIERLSSVNDLVNIKSEPEPTKSTPGSDSKLFRPPSERKATRTSAATVDKAIEHLKLRFQQMNVTIPLVRETDFVYRMGRERLYIQIIQGKLVCKLK